jgi:aryl carrier-like protein
MDAVFVREGARQPVAFPVERADAADERPLSAYVNDPRGDAPDMPLDLGGDVRRWARTHLPAYMVPSAVVVLEALPTTAHGKLDRAALPAPAVAASTAARRPASPEEETLAEIVASVLRLPHVGPDDNLFDIGADSLLVFQMSARAQRAGLALTPRFFFTHQTVAALAEAATSPPAGEAPDREAQLREQVRNMTPDEVRALLASYAGTQSPT